jgi:hypothetical protein
MEADSEIFVSISLPSTLRARGDCFCTTELRAFDKNTKAASRKRRSPEVVKRSLAEVLVTSPVVVHTAKGAISSFGYD